VRRLHVALLLLATACAGDDVTTTTLAPSTTSVESTTSYQESLAPVVVSRYGLMGWWQGEWIVPEGLEDIPVVGGEQYQVVMLDQPQSTAIGSAPRLCEPSLTPVLDFDPPLSGDFGDAGAIAVLSAWELRPSPITIREDLSDEHARAVVDVVEPLGIRSEPDLFQQVIVDLEGDSTDEVIIVAKQVADDLFAQPGDYSVVLLRKVIDGEWHTAILETSLAEANSPYILSHSIAAVADLNGDGKMEIAVDAAYYEGAGTTAYEYINDDLGPEAVLSGGCGA